MGAVEELRIPTDLTTWVSAAQLREWIMADVATLNSTHPELLKIYADSRTFSRRRC